MKKPIVMSTGSDGCRTWNEGNLRDFGGDRLFVYFSLSAPPSRINDIVECLAKESSQNGALRVSESIFASPIEEVVRIDRPAARWLCKYS